MYLNDIKENALKLIRNGKTVKEIGDILNIPLGIIYNWMCEEIKEQKDLDLKIERRLFFEINTLLKEGKENEAIELCNQHLDKINFRAKKASILYSIGLYEEALNTSDLKELENNEFMQKQKVKALIALGRYMEAIEIIDSPTFKNCDRIQELKVLITIPNVGKKIHDLMKERKIEEALKLSNYYGYNPNIQAQRIKMLIDLNRCEEAIQICSYSRFADSKLIQEQHINALIKLSRYSDAIKLASKTEFETNENIQSIKKNLEPMQRKTDEMYTRIYIGNITLEEINNSDIDEYCKIIFKLLYLEKNKLPGALNIIKQAKIKYKKEPDKVKIFNKLGLRFQSKGTILLDYFVYSSIIGCSFCEKLIAEHREKQKVDTNLVPKRVVLKPKVEKTNDNIILLIGRELKKTTLNEYISQQEIKRSKIKVDKKEVIAPKKEKATSIDISKIKIQDVYPKEVEDIKKYLYVEMNKTQSKKIIELFDRFCILVEKSVTDSKAVIRFFDFATRVNEICSYVTIDIESMKTKKHKYVKPSN